MFKIHGGDFLENAEGSIALGSLALPVRRGFIGPKMEVMAASELLDVEIATEETLKRMAGAVGWGIAGSLALGPVGLLAGVLVGGRKKEITLIATLQDGRRFVATVDAKTFTKLQAAALTRS
ncbi:MAG: hypothetical protein OXI35_06475 [Gemmatimonadota bacterium]|nr:hypothetical protein [Gemmatimonadota bacterium]